MRSILRDYSKKANFDPGQYKARGKRDLKEGKVQPPAFHSLDGIPLELS